MSVQDLFVASAATLFYKEREDVSLRAFLEVQSNSVVDEDWQDLFLEFHNHTIRLHRIKWVAGNRVAKTILSIFNYLKGQFGDDVRHDARVQQLLDAEYSIGIIFEPDLLENDSRLNTMQQILSISKAVVLNGETLIDYELNEISLQL